MAEQDERVSGPLAHRPALNLQQTLARATIRQRFAGAARHWSRGKSALAAEGERVSGPLVPPRSRRLTAVAMVLTILPPLLVYPLYQLYLVWILPIIHAAYLHCPHNGDCPAGVTWLHLGGLLFLGVPLLVAVTSFILGYTGVVPAYRRPNSLAHVYLLKGIMVLAFLWAFLFGVALMFWMIVAGMVL